MAQSWTKTAKTVMQHVEGRTREGCRGTLGSRYDRYIRIPASWLPRSLEHGACLLYPQEHGAPSIAGFGEESQPGWALLNPARKTAPKGRTPLSNALGRTASMVLMCIVESPLKHFAFWGARRWCPGSVVLPLGGSGQEYPWN